MICVKFVQVGMTAQSPSRDRANTRHGACRDRQHGYSARPCAATHQANLWILPRCFVDRIPLRREGPLTMLGLAFQCLSGMRGILEQPWSNDYG
jgi:hypothetical protein